ncbi:MAG TPA: YafY family protein [Mesorhizobium sp.]|jgi:predicted DNA-binding transcriptional regulator YafY|uniref:helix-turn-helix transcriptional regulator n=1 Tax=Mesorhizobium sp. TaxID=1871066 RepID=UPI002DDD4DC2|nr:YafY family protein [Mesorhizobium sp.]HEV2502391.1 YafY family protein [Mesorhizobium sp.]
MARPDRLFRLLHALRMLPAPVTAARLAEETGVSLRSLYRDIDSLRAAGARIEGERGYGYRLTEDDALPPQTFDRMELEAIALGMADLQSFGDPALARAAVSVLAKIGAAIPTDREQQLFHAISHVYRPLPRYEQVQGIDVIREGCWLERALEFCYVDAAGAETERTVFPLAITYANVSVSLLAWCCLRGAFRIFRVERIGPVRLGTKSFRPRRAALLRDYLDQLRQQEAS